jgi:hypothetical protein
MLNANGGCVGALSANAKYIGILLTARNKYVTNGFKQCIKRNQLVTPTTQITLKYCLRLVTCYFTNFGCVGALSANAKYIGILFTARDNYVTNEFKLCIKSILNQLVEIVLSNNKNIVILFAARYMLYANGGYIGALSAVQNGC